MSEDTNTVLYRILTKYMTKKEIDKLESLVSEHGSLIDVILVAVRKMINPNLITYDEIEACLEKAIKINAYVTAINSSNLYPSDASSPLQIAREVAQSVDAMNSQPVNNPFAEMLNAFRQQLISQIIEEMRSRLNIPISATPRSNSIGNGNLQSKGNAIKNDDIFMGDAGDEE